MNLLLVNEFLLGMMNTKKKRNQLKICETKKSNIFCDLRDLFRQFLSFDVQKWVCSTVGK